MGKIILLDENTANQIAAGEVIERPASIVKEMVENALDANATAVTVDITGGGIKSIRITDNGGGMEADDVELAFERHATSKIRSIDDLNRLQTMGFRGEALASIASVAKVEVITKTEEAAHGIRAVIEGGNVLSVEPAGAPKGTTFTVRELFYNTPARYKFLKKDTVEAGYIQDILARIALARPDVSFKLTSQGRTLMHTPGNHDLLSVIYSVYGKDIARAVVPVKLTGEGVEVSGYVGKPEIVRGNRSYQTILVNGRVIYNRTITVALEEAYKTRLMQKRFPFAVLKLNISPHFVDVNVHPAKLEVRFSDEQKVFRAVYHSVSEALAENASFRVISEVSETRPGQVNKEYPINMAPAGNSPSAAKSPVLKEDTPDRSWQRHGHELQNVKFDPQAVQKEPSISKSGNIDVLRTAEIGQKKLPEGTGDISRGFRPTEYPVAKTQSTHPVVTGQQVYGFQPTDGGGEKARETAGHADKPEGAENPAAPGDVPQISKAEEGKERLLRARIVGQAFESYILLEEGDDLILIDQHAAHERVRYETLKKQYLMKETFSQGLLSPLVVNLSELEMERFRELSDHLQKLGFEAEDFGNRSVLIRAVPYILDSSFSAQDFLEILEKLSQEAPTVSEILPEETLFMMACKSAIKANRSMSPMEIRGLVEELVNTENPYTCVHGRPVIITMGEKELQKRFKRIV